MFTGGGGRRRRAGALGPRELECVLGRTFSSVAAIADAYILTDAEPGKRHVVAGALLTKNVATVAAVVLAVEGGECGTASHTDIAVDPLGCGERFDESGGDSCGVRVKGGKVKLVVALELLVNVGDVAHVCWLCLRDL